MQHTVADLLGVLGDLLDVLGIVFGILGVLCGQGRPLLGCHVSMKSWFQA